MSATTKYFAVDLFQINCSGDSVGECAIMLLLLKDRNTPTVAGEVKSAVLIDGGFNRKAVDGLVSTIQQIEKAYTLTTSRLQFDAVSISHWDRDHWYGFCVANWSFLGNGANGWDHKAKQFNCFKYDNTASPPKPLTRLYCCPLVTDVKSRLRINKVDPTTMDAIVTDPLTGEEMWYESVLLGCSMTNTVLGVNLFNASVLGVSAESIKSLDLLLSNNDPWKAVSTPNDRDGAPGLYAVGANRVVLGGGVSIIPVAPTAPNAGSIMLVLAWRNAAGTGQPRISFYSGGDAEYSGEEALASWLTVPSSSDRYQIKVVKAGHHGSRAGTSMSFIEAVKPDHYLVSAGTQYGHPVVEIVWYLDAWFKSQFGGLGLSTPGKRIHGVCFPYYFGLTGDPTKPQDVHYFNSKYMRLETFAKGAVQKKPFWVDLQTHLQQLYPPANVTAATDPVSQATTQWFSGSTKAEDIQWLSSMTRTMWDRWSGTDYHYYPVSNSSDENYQDMTNKWLEWIIEYVHVTFQYSAQDDAVFTPNIVKYPGFKFHFGAAPASKTKTKKKKKKKYLVGSTSGIAMTLRSGRIITANIDEKVFTQNYEDMVLYSETVGDDYGSEYNPVAIDPPPGGTQLASTPIRLDNIAFPYEFNQLLPANSSPSSTQLILPAGSNLDSFVVSLLDSSLSLSSPVNLASNNDAWSSNVDDNDDVPLWFNSVFAETDGIATISVFGVGISVTGFGLKLTGFTTAASWTLAYSSDMKVLASAFGVDTSKLTPFVDAQGLFMNFTGLLLGLDTTQSTTGQSISLSDIFNIVELDYPTWLNAVLAPSTALALSTEPGATNGIWFYPASNYATTFRIQTTEVSAGGGQTLTGFLTSLLLNASFTTPTVIATKHSSYRAEVDPSDAQSTIEYVNSVGDVCIRTSIQFNKNASAWDSFLNIGENTIDIILRWGSGDSPLDDFLGWIEAQINSKGVFDNHKNILANAGSKSSLQLRQASISASYDSSAGKYTFTSFSMDFEVDLEWGVPADAPPGTQIPIGLSFSWTASSNGQPPLISFIGQLWPTLGGDAVTSNLINPYSQPFTLLLPVAPKARSSFSLLALPHIDSDSLSKVPVGIPTEVSSLYLDLSTQSIQFTGTLSAQSPPNSNPGNVPPLTLNEISLSATYTYSAATPSLDVSFFAIVYLNPRQLPPASVAPTFPATKLVAEIDYANGAWTLLGKASSMSMACLYSLFPVSHNDALMDVMEDILVPNFQIEYDFDSGVGKTFEATGVILLGDVELDLDIKCMVSSSQQVSWTFRASLCVDFTAPQISLGGFLTGIASDLGNILPAFIHAMTFSISSPASIALDCCKLDDDPFIIFSVVAKVDDFEFSFVQLTPCPPNPNILKKRLLKFTVDTLPGVGDVPFLANLVQPFDQMDFLWVDVDLTASDVAIINAQVYTDIHDQLMYKPPLGTGQNTDTVISAGCHFIVIVEESNTPSVVIDYCFNDAPPSAPRVDDIASGGIVADPPATPNNGAASAVFTKTMGPLTVSAIGLKYQEGDVQMTFDATVQIGPVGGSLRGFGIEFPVSKIQKFSLTDLTVLIDGVGLALNQPPVVMSGLMVKTADLYRGGISMEVEPYTFMAGGVYGSVQTAGSSNNTTFKTVFVFAQMDGPLVELEFASVSGITGGFGHNSAMTVPNASNVTQFPFIASATFDPDPLKVLSGLLGGSWFAPADGPIWFAAGLHVSAFQALSIQAVVAVDLSADVVFGVFADCQAKIPEAGSSDDELFALVDLGLVAIVDYAKGIFHAEGQLNPQSFILDKNCHLTGGFALCYWYAGSGHEGDWVFTVGGYHSAFTPPSHYPVPVRLGISWQYDSQISINGQAYFAVNPKVCMGGGQLSLTFKNGSLGACFDAWADFLINYRPFSFVGEVGVSIAVMYTVHVGCFTYHFNVHFGASLHLHGPPVAGYAHVDWSIISFDIYFGESTPNTAPLVWTDFYNLLCQQGAQQSPQDSGSAQQQHSITATAGLASSATGPPGTVEKGDDPWLVDGSTFAFRVDFLFPITILNYTLDSHNTTQFTYTGPKTYMKPMHIMSDQNVTSEVYVSVVDSQSGNSVYAGFDVEPIVKLVPTALWSPYDPSNDPSTGSTITSLLQTNDSTKSQMMGIQFNHPPSRASPDQIPSFNVNAACSYIVSQPVLPAKEDVPGFSAWQRALPAATSTAVQTAWANPQYSMADVLTTWAAYSGAKPGDDLSGKLSELGKASAPPKSLFLNWDTCYNQQPPLMAVGA